MGVGAALFMLISKYGFSDVAISRLVVVDPSRMAAQIVTGTGFLGAGLIFIRRGSVRGLTTAASIWVTAAIGSAAGSATRTATVCCATSFEKPPTAASRSNDVAIETVSTGASWRVRRDRGGFLGLWLIPGATSRLALFLPLFGASYFFAEFGPNTTTFVYPAEIFPVRVRTTCYGIAAAAGKLGAFAGTYALTALLPQIGLGRTSAIVAACAVLGAIVTVALLPEPKGVSLEALTERAARR